MSNKTVVEEELTRTTDTDEAMKDVAESLHKYTLSRQNFSTWNAKSKILKMFGTNSPSLTMTILTFPKQRLC